MSIDETLNNYRDAVELLQYIISRGVKTKEEILKLIEEDLNDDWK